MARSAIDRNEQCQRLRATHCCRCVTSQIRPPTEEIEFDESDWLLAYQKTCGQCCRQAANR